MNHEFRLYTEALQTVQEFSIFNRWGQRVFVSYTPAKGWDGIFQNKPSDAGVYHFYLKYKCSDGTVYFKKGDVHLIR